MSIHANIRQICSTLPEGVKLLCVSKYHTIEQTQEAYDAGIRDFGESRAAELEQKALALPDDIRWHFIGHLQRNKAKNVCRYASMIQSVDSLPLLITINSVATKQMDVLLEIHVAEETTKTGLSVEQLNLLFQQNDLFSLRNIRIRGLMGMATQTDDTAQIHREFKQLKELFDQLRRTRFADKPYFDILSMGMSNDYEIAISEGSNMVRIGSLIFDGQNE
ncbi:MAG: YggS family pyridoxal phosphate-dependent enzyme [Paludibacteraceae bacterium]|nr:YggS family pyridoxal phosphate-dependent enzyme [Paludibacteraceae bacterium]